jgi:hypothetical protein
VRSSAYISRLVSGGRGEVLGRSDIELARNHGWVTMTYVESRV